MSKQSTPSPPSAGQSYAQGIQAFLKYLPQLLSKEQQYRATYDPQRIAAQQALQAQYGPTQYAQQLAALQQLDPYSTAIRAGLGTDIQRMLAQGAVNPQQAALYNQLAGAYGNAISQGGFTPQQAANYQQLGQLASTAMAQGGLTPVQARAYQALGQNVMGQLGMGYSLGTGPGSLGDQVAQAARAAQAARGNILGNAPASAEALYTGQRAQQLYQQRVGNVQSYLQLQNPEAIAAQLGMAYGQLASPQQQALAGAQGFYQQQSPQANLLANAGSFLAGPTPESQIGAIQGVTPDRSYGYVNPNAGYQGQQFALANYGNQLAAQQGQSNPWSTALGIVGGAAGAYFGGPMGASAGYNIGSQIGGYFSDRRMKTDIKRVGKLDVYDYRYKPQFGIPGRFRSPMSEDIRKLAPSKVSRVNGMDYIEPGSGIPQFRKEEE